LERLVSLATIDDLWAEHLAGVSGLREATQWTSWANHDPLHEYLKDIDEMFQAMQAAVEEEIPKRLAQAEATGLDPASAARRGPISLRTCRLEVFRSASLRG
jgi:preprotein translocase subunit SecA